MTNQKKVCEQCKRERSMEKNRKICFTCRRHNMRLSKGEIRPPDYPDVNVAKYKEPMQKVEDGFGYYGAVTETNDGKQIQCHICGLFYPNLGSHIIGAHKMASRDYKIKYGLRINDGLMSKQARWEAQTRYNKFARKTKEEFAAMSRKGAAAIAEKKVKLGGDNYSAQTRNEQGTCKEQTLAKIRHIASTNNGFVSLKLFESEYGQGARSTVTHWFGSWAEGVKAAGQDSYFEKLELERKRRRPAAEEAMRRFYKENGRTPMTSDFYGVDYLPSPKYITKEYGSLNNGRNAAGVPLIVGGGHTWVEWIPGTPHPFENARKRPNRYKRPFSRTVNFK